MSLPGHRPTSVFLALRGPPTLDDAHGPRGLGALEDGQVGLHPDLVDGLVHKVELEPGRELLPAPIGGIPLARVLAPCPGTACPGVFRQESDDEEAQHKWEQEGGSRMPNEGRGTV